MYTPGSMSAPRSLPFPLDLPPSLRAPIDALAAAGHEAFLVGRCVRQLLSGEPVRDFEATTSATQAELLALFARAVPTDALSGRVMLPTDAGPLDLTPFAFGDTLTTDLAHRDFTVHGMGYDAAAGRLIDPAGGREDLAKALLRCVGDAEERLREDPLRAVRAARLVATLGLSIDPPLEGALRGARRALQHVPRVRLRDELVALLLGAHAGRGLALLRRSGVERAFTGRTREDAAAVVDRLPFDLELRLAAWLRGARPVSSLRRLRFSRRQVTRVERLLRLHPVDAMRGDVRVRRLVQRAPGDLPGLIALREAEIVSAPPEAGARERLEAFRDSVERVRRAGERARRRDALALDGRAVIEHLGLRPGPAIGLALDYLARRVEDDPSLNTPEGLRALLDAWPEAPRSATRPPVA